MQHPALREEHITRVMWFLLRPIFSDCAGVHPAQKSEMRAHQMALKLRGGGFTPQKSELSSHQMTPGGVVAHWSSWTESCEPREGRFPPLFGLRPCDRLLISTLVDFCGPARPAWHHWVRRLSQDSLHPSACLLRRHLHSRCLV